MSATQLMIETNCTMMMDCNQQQVLSPAMHNQAMSPPGQMLTSQNNENCQQVIHHRNQQQQQQQQIHYIQHQSHQ
jgi:hypothetical protein